MKKTNIKVAALLLAVLFTISAAFMSGCSKKEAPVAEANANTDKKDQYIEAFGTVAVKQVKSITIDFPARLVELAVSDGQRVKQGEVLAVLGLEEYNKQLELKEKELSIVKLELEKSLNVLLGEKNDIKRILDSTAAKKELLTSGSDPELKKLQGNLKVAEEAYKAAQDALIKKQAEHEKGEISAEQLEHFIKDAAARSKAAEDTRLTIESVKLSKQAEISQLQAHIDQKLSLLDSTDVKNLDVKAKEAASIKIIRERISIIETELQAMREKLNSSLLKGSSVVADTENGIVYEIAYIEGDILSPSRKLCSIMNLDTILIEAKVPEEFINSVKLNAAVEIIPLADRSKSYSGKVSAIAGRAVQQNGETSVPVQITVDNPDDFLLPGFNVDLFISKL